MAYSRIKQEIFKAYEGESKAWTRLRVYAEQADGEGFPYVAKLFRAASTASGVHARNNMRQLGSTTGTAGTVDYTLSRGTSVAQSAYNRLAGEADKEGDELAAQTFGWMRDAEREHAKLYEKAREDISRSDMPEFRVCDRCGYIMEGPAPVSCPLCGRSHEYFVEVD